MTRTKTPILLLLLFLVCPLAAQDFRPPQRIITPNSNGPNAALVFQNVTSSTSIDIFDENGRRVRHMQGVFSWNGQDDSGRVVESGVYIYQVKDGNGNTVSGVVAVAK
jgi:flagellar hook assembly protein FlgD